GARRSPVSRRVCPGAARVAGVLQPSEGEEEMAKVQDTRGLLEAKLTEMLYVERQLADQIVPKLQEEISNARFQRGTKQHLEQTQKALRQAEQGSQRLTRGLLTVSHPSPGGGAPSPASPLGFADGEGRARDRRRHARLRLHGQGALERLPQARVHDVAAAAA